MKRRWFGVFLMLFSSVAVSLMVLPSTPAYAASGIGCPGGPAGQAPPTANYPCPDGGAVENGTYKPETLLGCPGRPMAPITANYTCLNGGQVINGAYSPPNALGCPGNPPAPITANYVCPDGGSVVNGQYLAPGPVPGAQPADTTKPVDCDAGPGFTWIICGLTKLAVGAVEAIRDGVIVPFLKEPAFDHNLPQFQTAYALWGAFRNIASVFFILVFFMVIIGTAAGFDNYTIKKIMPHLVAGAILIPFSWFFCAFIIDIGNVLGQGVVNLVSGIFATMPAQYQPKIDLTSNFQLIFFGLTAGAAGTALMLAAAPIGMGVILSMLIALVGVFLTLVLRKIFIMLAVIFSPIAILAWVLPNTSKWFSEWWKNFFKLVMMYPIIMMLFEGGRIFSATAGATVTGTPADWVVPVLQIMGLILPLFMVPWAFKFAGKGLSAGSTAVGKFTGGLDKRFGKDSDGAKMAAKNREMKNMIKGRDLMERAGKADKAGNVMAARRLKTQSRLAYRRAGHAIPFNTKTHGFGSNPAAMLANEDAFGAATAMRGKFEANDLNGNQKIPKESVKDRIKAEARMAQKQKLEGRAQRMGIVAHADALGADGEAKANREIFKALKEQSRVSQSERAGKATGYNMAVKSAPALSVDQLQDHSAKLAEAAERENRGVIKDEIEMSDELDTKAIRDYAANNNGATISVQRAHEMRMKALAESAGRNAGNKMLTHEADALASNAYSRSAAIAEQERTLAATGQQISTGEAHRNRMDSYMAATVSRSVNSKLADEGKDLSYNEIEQEAGGPLNPSDVIKGARLNSRESDAANRAKLIAPLSAQNPDGSDKVSTKTIVDTADHAAVSSFGDSQGNIEAASRAMQQEAELSHIDLQGPGGKTQLLAAAASRSYDAAAKTKGDQLTETIAKKEGIVKGEQRNIKKAQIMAAAAGKPVPSADQVRGRMLANKRTAAVVSSVRATTSDYANDQAVMNDLKANPITQNQVYDAALLAATGDVSAKTGNIIAGANTLAAEARTAGVAPGSQAAGIHAAHEVAAAARISKEKQLSEHIADERALIDADKKAHVTPEQYMRAARDEKSRQLTEKATAVITAANNLDEAAVAEQAANGGTIREAEARVRDQRLSNVKETGMLKGATAAAASVQAERETAAAARELVATEAAKVAANPATPAGTDTNAQARLNIANTRATATGRAAGVKFTEDVESDLGAAETLENSVQEILNDPANAGMSRETAQLQAQTKQFTDAGSTARDISGRRLETEMATKDGSSHAVDLAIEEQIKTDEKSLGALPPDQARVRAKSNILKAINKDARHTAAETRIGVTRKSRGAANNIEAAAQIQAERDYINPIKDAAKKAKEADLKTDNTEKKIVDQKMEEFDKGIAPGVVKTSPEHIAERKEVEEAAKAYARDQIEAQIEQAGEEKAAETRRYIEEERKKGNEVVGFDSTSGEDSLLNAAGDAAEEEAGVTEATTQGRRIAYSEAFNSDKRTTDKTRIEGTIRTNIDARAKDAAIAKVKETEKTRSYDTAFDANLNVQEEQLLKTRAAEASKLRFNELGSNYQEAITQSNNGVNPFGNLPLADTELDNAGNKALVSVVKEAIKSGDLHIAQAALDHLVTTNGGFHQAKEDLQYLPVAQGGFGGDTWNQVDRFNPMAPMLKSIWNQSIGGSASKSNIDANKPAGVAFKGWKPEKLSNINDKSMERILDLYRTEPDKLRKDQADAAAEMANYPIGSPEYVMYETMAKDAAGRLNIVLNAQKDFEKAAQELIDHPNLAFDADALRTLVTKNAVDIKGKSSTPAINNTTLMQNLEKKLNGTYTKPTKGPTSTP